MLKSLRKGLSGLDRDAVLERLGLERKHDTLERLMPALAIFGAGVAVGVGIGMILAPRSGQELRAELQSQLKRVEAKVRGNDAEREAPPTAAKDQVAKRPA